MNFFKLIYKYYRKKQFKHQLIILFDVKTLGFILKVPIIKTY